MCRQMLRLYHSKSCFALANLGTVSEGQLNVLLLHSMVTCERVSMYVHLEPRIFLTWSKGGCVCMKRSIADSPLFSCGTFALCCGVSCVKREYIGRQL
jgi:hypothetical protein